MTERLKVDVVEALADIVTRQMGLVGRKCKRCQSDPVARWHVVFDDCRVMIDQAYGGYKVVIRHADGGIDGLSVGFGPLREAQTFLQGMRQALSWRRDL
jgi:hypothetical protein